MDAPYFHDIASDDTIPRCVYRWANDTIRLRMAYWAGGDAGTVLLVNGRTEFIEKYAHVANQLTKLGYHVIALDWRGQGLSDRYAGKENMGYVSDFMDYQRDLHAAIDWAAELKLPPPDTLFSLSMGGMIALRAIEAELPIKRAIFSAPMWQIILPSPLGIVRESIHRLAAKLRLIRIARDRLKGVEYDNNPYTTDPDQYARRVWQYDTHPALRVGPPGLRWVYHAIKHSRWLLKNAHSDLPMLVLLGCEESIVSQDAIRGICKHLPNAQLAEFCPAKHELMIETPNIQAQIWQRIEIFLRGD